MSFLRRCARLAGTLAFSGAAGLAQTVAQTVPEPLPVFAAGSLREVLGEIAQAYEAAGGPRLALRFGASGLLRESIEKGEGAQLFASADTEHPQRLAARGGWGAPVVFVRNSLCALAQPALDLTAANLLETLLRPTVRVGSSTPKADPSGDYAWALFRRADALRPGAYAQLDAKALQLTGAADSPKPPPGRGTYAWVMDEGRADVFLTYCTNAVAAQREVPRLKIVQIPPELQVFAAYGLGVRDGAPPAARRFADYLLGPQAQAVFLRHGFAPP